MPADLAKNIRYRSADLRFSENLYQIREGVDLAFKSASSGVFDFAFTVINSKIEAILNANSTPSGVFLDFGILDVLTFW